MVSRCATLMLVGLAIACGDARPELSGSGSSASPAEASYSIDTASSRSASGIADPAAPVDHSATAESISTALRESATSSDAPPGTPHRSAPRVASLTLEGDGLRAFISDTGSARPIPFGIPASEALVLLTRVQGSPPETQGENLDCGAAYATWDGLTVWFDRDRFAGWSLRGRDDRLTTASGIGIGSTLGQLNGAYDARIAQSTLGTEFTAGGLAGLLDTASPDARIVNLWSGVTCLAR